MQVPIFDRIVSIGYTHRDTRKIQLDRKDFASLQELEQVWMAHNGEPDAIEQASHNLKEIVPACRLSSVEATPTRINAELDLAAVCCSP